MSTASTTYFTRDMASFTSGSPKTHLSPLAIPSTEGECDALLRATTQRLRVPEYRRFYARQLARFLGASSRIWSPARRDALHAALVSAGLDGAVAALEALATNPRVDVADEAEIVLRNVAESASMVDALAARFDRVELGVVRAAIVRALQDKAVRSAFDLSIRALSDSDAEVREAAAYALARCGREDAKAALVRQLERERNAVVRQSIQDAVDELNGG